ncbi:DUF459 domain-containing protein [Rhizobium sp. ARZ01]|uniref:SGNH/GDSL hydrolase family protein n=1 Tax=Rhizobium sp. ARZ01 TaxID=2769313 RepID=UPI00177B5414|nr:DUF459 domain-containing protein [Rhizobium sp. ARZ01]MBD9373507.1 DUF459 domain-containing protein [Rhizobium sp. ARZ01]
MGRFRRVALLLTCLAVAVPPAAIYSDAIAQERVQRRTVLDLLFGGFGFGRRAQQRPQTYQQRQQPRRLQARPEKPKTKKKVPAAIAVPEPVVVAKLPDARKVLVVGDFVASGIGDGLAEAFTEIPGVMIEARTNGSSGLVRQDYYNWQTELPALIDEIKPAAVVVSLGANDRQMMAIGGPKEKFRSEAWTKEYEQRVANLSSYVRARNVPLLWVGMPAFQTASMTADMSAFNTIFRGAVEKTGGTFVDIWDGFVDEDGKFVVTGSDINGQQVRLRGSDGVSMTKAGKRKLAFYVEKEIRRILGDAMTVDGQRQGGEAVSDLVVTAPTDAADIVRTQPISLTDPALDGGTVLLGGSALDKGSGRSPRDRMIEKGEFASAPEGRVDDFRMNKLRPAIGIQQNSANRE